MFAGSGCLYSRRGPPASSLFTPFRDVSLVDLLELLLHFQHLDLRFYQLLSLALRPSSPRAVVSGVGLDGCSNGGWNPEVPAERVTCIPREPGLRKPPCQTQFPLLSFRYSVSVAQFPLLSFRYSVSVIQSPLFSLRYSVSVIQFPLFSFRYSASVI